MNSSDSTAHSLAYLMIAGGCLLALVTAFEPQPTRAWRLDGTWLLSGLIPYIVYGSMTALLRDCALLSSGFLLIGGDLIARVGLGLTAASQPGALTPVVLATLLVVCFLPAGALLGLGLGRTAACRNRWVKPDKPG